MKGYWDIDVIENTFFWPGKGSRWSGGKVCVW